MEQGLRRCCITAAVAVAAGGLIVAAHTVTPALPDVQVRDTELTADAADLQNSQISGFYDLVQQELGGNTDVIPHDTDLGETPFYGDDGTLNGIGDSTLNIDTMPDQDVLNSVLGGGSAADAIHDGVIGGLSPSGAGFFDGFIPGGGLFGGTDQSATPAANLAAITVADILPALPAAYQAFTDGVVSAELALNNALVEAQETAADRLFGEGTTGNDAANLMINVNNMALASNEAALNQLLGANFDPGALQNSLLTDFDPDALASTHFATLLGLTPDDFTALLQASEAGNFLILLEGLFPGLF